MFKKVLIQQQKPSSYYNLCDSSTRLRHKHHWPLNQQGTWPWAFHIATIAHKWTVSSITCRISVWLITINHHFLEIRKGFNIKTRMHILPYSLHFIHVKRNAHNQNQKFTINKQHLSFSQYTIFGIECSQHYIPLLGAWWNCNRSPSKHPCWKYVAKWIPTTNFH